MYNFVLQLTTRRVIISGCGMVGHMETLSTAHNSPRNELWRKIVYFYVSLALLKQNHIWICTAMIQVPAQ